MPKSLLEQLPEIVANGRKQAERILESIESRHRVQLQTREIVLPAKDAAAHDWIAAQTRQAQREAVFSPAQSTLIDPVQSGLSAAPETPWVNRLIYGDNLLAMAALLAGDDTTPSLRGKVDLIYIDPPFDSKADYRTKVTLPGVELEQKPTVIEQFAYSDTWSDGTASYLAMITPRLILMRELLADTGSIYVHLDWHVGHYVKVVMDEVFGKDSFVNEIPWQRVYAHNDSNRYGRVHDTIFFYSKSQSYHFKTQHEPYSEKYLQMYSMDDGDGRKYKVENTLGPGGRGVTYDWNGHLRAWRYSKENMHRLHEDGLLYYTKTGFPKKKVYLDEMPGKPVQDIWVDINVIAGQANELLDYATQKPEKLLDRIIRTSCPENGLVADFNGGSGTTAAVAEKLGRRWITTDLGKPACMIMRKRLIDQNAQPFLYQAIGDYQVEAARASLGRDFRIGDLSQIVLSLYGALPLSVDDSPARNLGHVTTGGVKTLVLADSPNKLTGTATLKKAIAQRDNLLGGWDRVVVLGWNFEPSIGETITALNDDRLEVLVIPPDLMDRLKKKGGLEKLRGSVRFSSLQYLTIWPVERTLTPAQTSTLSPALPRQGGGGDAVETLTVRLKNYVLLSPEAINLDEANRVKLQAIINAEPLALIEYWAVDPDYDGKVFRSVWQDYRGNTANDGDPLRVVDVFGFEAEVVTTVEAA